MYNTRQEPSPHGVCPLVTCPARGAHMEPATPEEGPEPAPPIPAISPGGRPRAESPGPPAPAPGGAPNPGSNDRRQTPAPEVHRESAASGGSDTRYPRWGP